MSRFNYLLSFENDSIFGYSGSNRSLQETIRVVENIWSMKPEDPIKEAKIFEDPMGTGQEFILTSLDELLRLKKIVAFS